MHPTARIEGLLSGIASAIRTLFTAAWDLCWWDGAAHGVVWGAIGVLSFQVAVMAAVLFLGRGKRS